MEALPGCRSTSTRRPLRIPIVQNLENIRRGQYEGLKEDVKTNPSRKPDFVRPVCIPLRSDGGGARKALIAYNVFLNTQDVEIAKKSPGPCASLPEDFAM